MYPRRSRCGSGGHYTSAKIAGYVRRVSARRVLLVEDDGPLRAVLARELGRHFVVEAAATVAHASAVLERGEDLYAIVCDDDLGPGDRGRALLARAAASRPRCLRVLVSGTPVTSIGDGTHFLRKPLDSDALLDVLLGRETS